MKGAGPPPPGRGSEADEGAVAFVFVGAPLLLVLFMGVNGAGAGNFPGAFGGGGADEKPLDAEGAGKLLLFDVGRLLLAEVVVKVGAEGEGAPGGQYLAAEEF